MRICLCPVVLNISKIPRSKLLLSLYYDNPGLPLYGLSELWKLNSASAFYNLNYYTMQSNMTYRIAGIIFLALGVLILYQLGRRRFNRRNAYGTEVFKSYGQAQVTRGSEGCARLLALGMICIGALLLLMSLPR